MFDIIFIFRRFFGVKIFNFKLEVLSFILFVEVNVKWIFEKVVFSLFNLIFVLFMYIEGSLFLCFEEIIIKFVLLYWKEIVII